MSTSKFPLCYGCDSKRLRSFEHRFCSNKCARDWAETMAEGYAWCAVHQAWEDSFSVCKPERPSAKA